MRHMKHKDNLLHLRIDAELLNALNELARRLGDDNTSAVARWAMRVGLIEINSGLPQVEPPTPEA
jgi:hypothetical protein